MREVGGLTGRSHYFFGVAEMSCVLTVTVATSTGEDICQNAMSCALKMNVLFYTSTLPEKVDS